MKRSGRRQYTIRSIPEDVDKALRRRARRRNQSLNQAALEALRRGLELGEQERSYGDLDHLIGSMPSDAEFDAILESQRRIDPDLWR